MSSTGIPISTYQELSEKIKQALEFIGWSACVLQLEQGNENVVKQQNHNGIKARPNTT